MKKRLISLLLSISIILPFLQLPNTSLVRAEQNSENQINDSYTLGIAPEVDDPSGENPKKTRLKKQIVWANFDNATNLGPDNTLQVGTEIVMEPAAGYILRAKVKSIQKYRATQDYYNKVINDPDHTEADLRSAELGSTDVNTLLEIKPQSKQWSNMARSGFHVPGNVTLQNSWAKKAPWGAKETGVTFEVSAEYGGETIPPTLIIADGEEAGAIENTIYKTDGTPWELMASIGRTEESGVTVKPSRVATIDELQKGMNARGALGKAKYLLATKKDANGHLVADPNGGLGTQTFSGVTNSIGLWGAPNIATPIVVSRDVREFSLYINNYGGLQSIMFGFVVNDMGDAPESYGIATHLIKKVEGESQPWVGSNPADTDVQLYERDWWSDDRRSAIPDKPDEGVEQLLGPNNVFEDADGVAKHYKAHAASDREYKLKILANNGGNKKSYIRGWIDFNHDGKFDNNLERSELIELTKNGTQQVELVFKNAYQIANTDIDRIGMRVRTALSEEKIRNATGFAFSGEAEDFEILVVHPPRGIRKTTTGCQNQQQQTTFTEKDGFNAFGKQNYNVGSLNPDKGAPSQRPENKMLIDSKHKIKIVTPEGNLVDSYTAPNEGTYTLSGDFNETITFVPLKSFRGTATGVALRASDGNGRDTGWTNSTDKNNLKNINGEPLASDNSAGGGYLINNKKTMDALYVPVVLGIDPEGTPITSTDKQGYTQTVKPQFIPGVCSIDPNIQPQIVLSSIVFDDGTKSKTVENQGTYTIQNDGTITFVPIPSFFGAASPVKIKAQDEYGNWTEPITYTPTVTKVNPAVKIIKSVDRQKFRLNEELTYTFTVTNTGDCTLHNISVSDPLVSNSSITPLKTTLQPGEQTTATATYTPTQENVDTGFLTNTARVDAIGSNNQSVSHEDSNTIKANQNPSLELEKSVTSTGSTQAIAVGDVLTYTFTVTNTGNVTMDQIEIKDPMIGLSPITLVKGSKNKIAPGEVSTFTATYQVNQMDVNNSQVVNNAKAEGLAPHASEKTLSDPASVKIPAMLNPSIKLVKEVSNNGKENYELDDTLTYKFTVKNNGNATMTNVGITDSLQGLSDINPSQVDLLNPGDSCVFTATYKVKQSDVDNGIIENQASAQATAPDNTTKTVNSRKVEITAKRLPKLTLEKTYTKSGDAKTIAVNDVLTYNFKVTNTGNVTMSNIKINDSMEGLSNITLDKDSKYELAPGEYTNFTAQYKITQKDINAGKINNTATATGLAPSVSDPADATISDPQTVTLEIPKHPSLSLVKKEISGKDKDTMAVGDVLTYEFTVTNTGNVSIDSLNIVDNLQGLSDISLKEGSTESIDPGESSIFTATYTVKQSDVNNGSITNKAVARGKAPNSSEYTKSKEVSVTKEITANPSLTLEKTLTQYIAKERRYIKLYLHRN